MPLRMIKHYALYMKIFTYPLVLFFYEFINTSGVRFLLISEINPEDAVPSGSFTIKTYKTVLKNYQTVFSIGGRDILSAPVCACLRLSACVGAQADALAHRQMRWRTGGFSAMPVQFFVLFGDDDL